MMLRHRVFIIIFLVFALFIWIPVGMVVGMTQNVVQKVYVQYRRRRTRGKGRVIKYKDLNNTDQAKK